MDVRLVTGLNVVFAITLSEEEAKDFTSRGYAHDDVCDKMRGHVRSQMQVLTNIRTTLSLGGT